MPFQFKGQFNWSLLGIPDHAGVMNVGGRIGAALGPKAFRGAFARLKGQIPVQQTQRDLGDVDQISLHDPAANHRSASDRVCAAAGSSDLTVVVGGGHDHGFSHLRGLAEAFPGKKLGCINIDAHLDVRSAKPVITSGSPFYLAIENGVLKPEHLVEFGIQSHCNAPELWNYVETKKIQVVPYERMRGWKGVLEFKSVLNRLSDDCDLVAISLDLDAAAAAFAPGVSAPQAEGFGSGEIIEMMEEAARQKKVVSLGIFELNPLLDLDDRTARLAATAAWHFVEQRILTVAGVSGSAARVGRAGTWSP